MSVNCSPECVNIGCQEPDWLEKHNMSQFVSKVTSEKPRAVCYIDDKGVEFSTWESCFQKLEEKGIL